jgi:hypothetical protein
MGALTLRAVWTGRITTRAGVSRRRDDPVKFYIIFGLYCLSWLMFTYFAFREFEMNAAISSGSDTVPAQIGK